MFTLGTSQFLPFFFQNSCDMYHLSYFDKKYFLLLDFQVTGQNNADDFHEEIVVQFGKHCNTQLINNFCNI